MVLLPDGNPDGLDGRLRPSPERYDQDPMVDAEVQFLQRALVDVRRKRLVLFAIASVTFSPSANQYFVSYHSQSLEDGLQLCVDVPVPLTEEDARGVPQHVELLYPVDLLRRLEPVDEVVDGLYGARRAAQHDATLI